MLWFISIGLSDEKGMSLKALEMAKKCDILFAEFYTTKLNTTKERLEKLIGKQIRVLSRKEIEENYQELILNEAKVKKVGVLVGGDCFTATTHISLRLEAIKQGINTKVIHGSSIVSAVAETGLHIYRFGPIVTIPFPEKTKGKLPKSVYEVINENKKKGSHTLCLLDIVSEENRYMSVSEAMKILLGLEVKFKKKTFLENTEIIVFARAGNDKSLIVYGKVKDLIKKDFGSPSFVLIIPGKLHFTEKEYLENFRI